jgi:anti-sigma regulatory factor (Ser/Thr protein kinase)
MRPAPRPAAECAAPPRPRRSAPSTTTALVIPLDGEQPERRSRDLTGRVLANLGIDQDTADQVQLAVHELAANARRHAPPPRELRITLRPADVQIAVTDADARYEAVAQRLAAAASRPEQDADQLSESGRGLRIVAALFPGACGAGPAYAAAGACQAKQVWIAVPLPSLRGGAQCR